MRLGDEDAARTDGGAPSGLGLTILCLSALLAVGIARPAEDIEGTLALVHAWEETIRPSVSESGEVAYRQLAARRPAFDRLLHILREMPEPPDPHGDAAVAFWINAHNLLVLSGVLEGLDPETLAARARLYQWFSLPIAGKPRTLEEVLALLEPRASGDPRIYFTLSNGTRDGPILSPEPYRGETLDAMLADRVRRFVRDPRRNRFDSAGRRVELSRVFFWHQDAFERAGGSLAGFVARYSSDVETKSILRQSSFTVAFSPFDWSLNAAPGERPF